MALHCRTVQSQNAELDQSPSVTMRPGDLNLSSAAILMLPPFWSAFIPKDPSTSMVIFMYPVDSALPLTSILFSPLIKGIAISRPLMNCELTLPGRLNVPPESLPERVTSLFPIPDIDMPCSSRLSHKGPIGLCGSLPLKRKPVFTPSAAATGTRNL